MQLALFDLDNTLLGGDSDYEWGQFLVEQGVVDAEVYERENQRFYEQYKAGTLDIYEFSRFAYQPLANNALEDLQRWRANFLAQRIKPMVLPKALALVDQHRQQGHTLAIITATNRFVTEPIAALFAVDHLFASEPEFKNGRYTGELTGTPCFQEGKVKQIEAWLATDNITTRESWCYSDSHNDLPLLEYVDHPCAVDADATLTAQAHERGWPLISLRD